MKERLYRYSCKAEGSIHTGTTWNTSRKNVIQDVHGNFSDPKRIFVCWLKPDRIEYKLAMIERGETS